jgi:hypothetical protein
MALLKPKPVTVKDCDRKEHHYMIHRFEYWTGREIILQYPTASLPKLGDYSVSEALAAKMMAYVTIKSGDLDIALTTRELVSNHVPDAETGLALELELMQYNYSFFTPGAILSFFGSCAPTFKGWITSISKGLQEHLSQQTKQSSGNSKGQPQSTTSKTQ